MKIKNLFLGVFSVFVLSTACSEIFPPDINSDEVLDQVISDLKGIDKEKYKIKSARLSEKEKLSSEFGMLSINLEDMEGKTYSQSIFYNMPSKGTDIEEDRIQPSKRMKKEIIPVDVEAINKEVLQKSITEAKGMIPEGYTYKSIGSIEFNTDKEGNLIYKLVLNVTEDGNSTKVQGRNIVTEYYEVKFDIDKDGNLTLKE